ncbi:Transcription-repair-coupling factor OS=Ureibacillus acetophenoni OX=614649 GN=mfd PE=3 SV=1 [Ureibacillus acetophenoni]
MDGQKLIVTIDEKKCGKYQPFDVLEQMIELDCKKSKSNSLKNK